MAVCPKCGYKLKLTDISPNCPKCATNLMFHDFAERFYREAKYAEMDLASFRVRLARVKAAYVGGKLQKARFAAVLLPLAALLAPFGTVTVSLPLFTKVIRVGGTGVYGLLTDGGLGALLDFRHSALTGACAGALSLALLAFGAVALLAVALLLAQLLCFIKPERTCAVLAAVSAAGVAASAVAFVLTARIPDFGSLVTASPDVLGPLCCVAAFSVVLALNAALRKKGVRVEYREGDLYRAETLRRYKRHEITLDELPLPVYETQEEREERERKIRETAEMIAGAE